MRHFPLVLLLGGCASSQPAQKATSTETTAPLPKDASMPAAAHADPFLWLEEVTAEPALKWVRERNAVSEGELGATAGFDALQARLRAIYDSKEKIPTPEKLGRWLYNFWTDAEHARGLWRRTSLAEYRKKAPRWETVLDIDALNKTESKSWVWQGAICLPPKYERCLVRLSPAGSDAAVVREFDVMKKAFVKDGFFVPEAKTRVFWKDLDTLYVATDFGPGTLTTSGYPRVVKEWKRGQKLADAPTVFEGQDTDVSVMGFREFDHGKTRDWMVRYPSFFTEERHLVVDGKLERLDKPEDAEVEPWDDQLLLKLRSPWEVGGKTWPAGALLAAPLADYRAGKRDFTMLFEPTPSRSLEAYVGTKSGLLLVVLEDVKSTLSLHKKTAKGWTATKVETSPMVSLSVSAVDEDESDDYWLTESGLVTPTQLLLGRPGKKAEVLKANPVFFDAAGVEVTQHFATSKDGTKVPYFQVARKGLVLDATTPTVLYGYGGFEISQTPFYLGSPGAAWVERGGAWVLANIRGGGEYGPKWHQAALKENRQRAYDDFIAVAEDLVARKVTSPAKLGTTGGSNGGLLVGVMLTQRPDLFGAVVCQVPLLDMRRYHKLLAGASWMEEYGDPDKPEEWKYLERYSPYHQVSAATRYPRTLFTTSTRDDRVHPGHARKMVAKMLSLEKDVLYYENIEGGHGGAADAAQRAHMVALAYAFFTKQLGPLPKPPAPPPAGVK